MKDGVENVPMRNYPFERGQNIICKINFINGNLREGNINLYKGVL